MRRDGLAAGIAADVTSSTCREIRVEAKSHVRRRAGILTGDILEELDKLPPDERQRASTAIEEVELEVQLLPGLYTVAC